MFLIFCMWYNESGRYQKITIKCLPIILLALNILLQPYLYKTITNKFLFWLTVVIHLHAFFQLHSDLLHFVHIQFCTFNFCWAQSCKVEKEKKNNTLSFFSPALGVTLHLVRKKDNACCRALFQMQSFVQHRQDMCLIA